MTTARRGPLGCAALAAACLATASPSPAQPLRLDGAFGSLRGEADPVAWLLAQAAPAAAPPDPTTGVAPRPEAPTWAARIFPFVGSGEPVGFAPARWGGTIALEFLEQRGEEGRRRHLATTSATLAAASYFWQPWFAQVRGTLTVLGSLEKGAGGTAAGETAADLRGVSVSGGGTVTVFPSSRFPFVASIDSTDSRSTGEFAPSDQRHTRASLRQSWRDPLGTTTTQAGLDYSDLRSASFGRDSVLQLDGRFMRSTEPHRLDAAINWSRNRRHGDDVGTDILRAYGTHLYSPTPDLWVSSLVNFTETGLDLGGAGPGFIQRLGQVTSQAVWRPEFDDRLVLTGGGRVFANQFSRDGSDATSHSESANGGASFALTEEATLNASANVTHVAVPGGGDSLVRLASVGATYASRPLDLKLASYSVSGSVQGGVQAGGPEASRTLASAQADHQLSRSVELGKSVSVNLLATQGGGVTDDTILGRTNTLRAGASASARAVSEQGSDAYFGGSYAWSRSKGGVNDRFRLANLQASGQLRFGAYDTLSANVTAQWVRSRHDLLPGEEDTRQVYGGLSYQHSRLFGVPRLRYLLSATFNEGTFATSRLLGDIEAPRENVTQLIDQRLLYDIGRLELRLGMRLAKVEGRDDLQWTLRIHRQIGQY